MKRLLPIIILFILVESCDHRKKLSDAYGNFEAEDVIVSAEMSGKLLQFTVREGRRLDEGGIVGLIDTVQLSLQLKQLEAQRSAVKSKIAGVEAQVSVQQQQYENLLVSMNRVSKLLGSGAATQQQQDDLDGQLKLIKRQIAASQTSFVSIQKEMAVVDSQKDLLLYQLSKCRIVNPVSGVILEKYLNVGEMAVVGKPLFKIADLSTLDLRCYVSEDLLSVLKLGQKVSVLTDGENGTLNELSGVISWISDEAEFTPKIIQTRKERVKLVYAVKVNVINDGSLKIGMPGEMVLTDKQRK
jgi:HlyD family secretion protein